MSSPKFPCGSEWRKWDLQVHTPYSALNNGFGSDFKVYAKALFDRAVEKEIAAIGITDYFSIDGYKQLRALVDDRVQFDASLAPELASKAREILLLPNIEFRPSVFVNDRRVNFHVIFSDEIAPDVIEEHFLRELKFTAESNPNSRDERWSLTPANLESLGRKLKEQHEKFRGRSDLWYDDRCRCTRRCDRGFGQAGLAIQRSLLTSCTGRRRSLQMQLGRASPLNTETVCTEITHVVFE